MDKQNQLHLQLCLLKMQENSKAAVKLHQVNTSGLNSKRNFGTRNQLAVTQNKDKQRCFLQDQRIIVFYLPFLSEVILC